MRIISKYKDYYDIVTHTYGADEKIVYVRKELGNKHTVFGYANFNINGSFYLPSFQIDNIHFAIVCNRAFPLYKINDTEFKLITKKWLTDYFEEKQNLRYYGKEEIFARLEKLLKCEYDERLMPLTRMVGAPIFIVKPAYNRKSVTVIGYFISLSSIGLARIYPAEQLYQDLSYFLANQMNDSPDLQPAMKPPMTDKEKINSHGFDDKISFRHRV